MITTSGVLRQKYQKSLRSKSNQLKTRDKLAVFRYWRVLITKKSMLSNEMVSILALFRFRKLLWFESEVTMEILTFATAAQSWQCEKLVFLAYF